MPVWGSSRAKYLRGYDGTKRDGRRTNVCVSFLILLGYYWDTIEILLEGLGVAYIGIVGFTVDLRERLRTLVDIVVLILAI